MVTIIFGSPGSGKSTLGVKLMKKGKKTKFYTNISDVTMKNVTNIDDSDIMRLGEWSPPRGSKIIVDEGGIIFNNRNWKLFPHSFVKWLKLHRHYGISEFVVLSQSWEDMDVTIRRLADLLLYIRKIGPFTLACRVRKTLHIDNNTHQIVDGYEKPRSIWLLLKPFKLIGLHFLFPQIDYWKVTFRPFYYKYFDSFDCPPLPNSPVK